jgi:hypothetical protein
MIEMGELREFILKAKTHTYAAAGESLGRNITYAGREIRFVEGRFRYRDRYYGWNPFVGEELVCVNNRIIWAMNYYGSVFRQVIPPSRVYQFLQKALIKVNKEKPFRGPGVLRSKEFVYINESDGDIDRFCGMEKILYKNHEIYLLDYHGGYVRTLK